MERLRHHWRNTPHPVRRFLIFVAGWAVVIAGVAMLALPGPGWATIFLGVVILATEYASAKRLKGWLITKLKSTVHKVKDASSEFKENVQSGYKKAKKKHLVKPK